MLTPGRKTGWPVSSSRKTLQLVPAPPIPMYYDRLRKARFSRSNGHCHTPKHNYTVSSCMRTKKEKKQRRAVYIYGAYICIHTHKHVPTFFFEKHKHIPTVRGFGGLVSGDDLSLSMINGPASSDPHAVTAQETLIVPQAEIRNWPTFGSNYMHLFHYQDHGA